MATGYILRCAGIDTGRLLTDVTAEASEFVLGLDLGGGLAVVLVGGGECRVREVPPA